MFFFFDFLIEPLFRIKKTKHFISRYFGTDVVHFIPVVNVTRIRNRRIRMPKRKRKDFIAQLLSRYLNLYIYFIVFRLQPVKNCQVRTIFSKNYYSIL